jgi:hypothetical protein
LKKIVVVDVLAQGGLYNDFRNALAFEVDFRTLYTICRKIALIFISIIYLIEVALAVRLETFFFFSKIKKMIRKI